MILRDIPFSDYQASPRVNASLLKQILRNPYAAREGLEIAQTPAMELGRAIHARLLTPSELDISQQSRQTIEIIEGVANAIKKSPAHKLIEGGEAELSVISTIEANGKEYQAKARLDYLKDGVIVDLKTSSDASPDGFTKAIANYDYALQAAFYLDICRAEGIQANQFVFLAVETKPPYMTGIYEIDPIWLEFGRDEYRRALRIFDQIDDYAEPIYRDLVDGSLKQTLTAPAWIFYRRGASY
jgi:hypothetical protein